jgi:hypothetical protein
MTSHVIKFSKTSKMPGQSFSIPASECKTGGKLAKIKGSVCDNCYARRGSYLYPNVIKAREHNYSQLPNDVDGWLDWENAIVSGINSLYFRWHDSGDIQSLAHLRAICNVADKLPQVKFWLPTKEFKMVRDYLKEWVAFPHNLIVRVSSPMVDQAPLKGYQNTSTVHKNDRPYGFECNAPAQGGECDKCRACWDATVRNVSYKKH